MNVGFYYHVEACFDDPSRPSVPSVVGLFIDELARQTGSITFYTHDGGLPDVNDFVLDDPRVKTVNLGPRRRAPSMTFNPTPTLRDFSPRKQGVDALIIRGPSALLPALRKASDVPVVLQLVGDPANETAQSFFPWWRNLLIRLWREYYMHQQDRATRGALVLANSPAIKPRRGGNFPNSEIVFTSTLTGRDLARSGKIDGHWTADKGSTHPVRLLYTGRFVKDKGLFEAVEAVAHLVGRGHNVELHLVGWSPPKDPTARQLFDQASRLGIPDKVLFGGYRPAGAHLLSAYTEHDIYVLPTYGEGFARSVIEAMAVGLPVVTTDIPATRGVLTHRENAYLVRRRSVNDLVDAIEDLIADEYLRSTLSRNASDFARELTLENACRLMLDRIEAWMDQLHEEESNAGIT